MNIYQMIGSRLGTREALELAERLSSWHDAMVAHERRGAAAACADDECPHSEADMLWTEAVRTFGPRSEELRFLRSRGERRVRGGAREVTA
jgi:hypothetical protein